MWTSLSRTIKYSYYWSVSIYIHFIIETAEDKKQAIQTKLKLPIFSPLTDHCRFCKFWNASFKEKVIPTYQMRQIN